MKTTMLALVVRSTGVLLAVNIHPCFGRCACPATRVSVVFAA